MLGKGGISVLQTAILVLVFCCIYRDPYRNSDDEYDDDDENDLRPMKIDIDLSLSAYANSRK